MAAQVPITPGYAMGPGGITIESTREQDVQHHVNYVSTVMRIAPGWVVAEDSTASISAAIINTVRQDLWMGNTDDGERRSAQDWERFKLENSATRDITNEFESFDAVLEIAAAATGIPMSNISLVIWEVPNFVDN